MRREEIDRLLARLSSGEITAAERAALYQAAIDDQALFEEIFAEQALAEALADEQLRDEFLLRESVRDDDGVLAEELEEELAAAPRLREVRARGAASAPVPIRPEKRCIPWWGWAVPAAVAASTVLGVFLLRQPAADTQVAQKVEDKPVQMAQAKPEQVAQPIAAPEAVAPAAPTAGVTLSADKSKQDVAVSGLRKEAATPVLGKSEEGAAVVRVAPTTQDLKDQPVREKASEVAAAAPAPAPPVMIRGAVTAVPETPARRADEADARQAPAQVAEFRVTEAKKAAAPAAETQNRAAAGASRARNAVLAMSPSITAAERESALALVKAAVLQTQDASGDWRDVASGARVPRGQKLRLKLTPTESGSWTLPGADTRSVGVAAGQTGYLGLPSYAPGAHALLLTFRPAESTPARAAADAVRPPLGRVSISFVIE